MIIKNGKELSAGIMFFTPEGSLFMARMTGLKLRATGTSRWDIPKGHVEENETPLRAAIRECWEETGFTDYEAALLEDLGEFDYARNKNIHLFRYPVPVDVECFRNCTCTAYFEDEETGEITPEMDRFACIKPEMWKHVMGPSLYRIMKNLYPEVA